MTYTPEQDIWLKENVQKFKHWSDICDAFNNQFNATKTKEALRGRSKVLGIRIHKDYYWTKEETDWILANYPKFSYTRDFMEEFSKHFDTDRNLVAFGTFFNARGIIPGFKPGTATGKNQPWNCKYSIGDEKIEANYIYVKVNNVVRTGKDNGRTGWVQKQRIIWEQHYGPLKDDEYVIFLDNNPRNFDISNLAKVDKKTMGKLFGRRWRFDNPYLTQVALTECEFENAIANARKNGSDDI